MKSRILSISKKEFIHIIHDYRTLMIVIAMPILQLILFGYALNMEIQNIDIAIADYDHSDYSKNLFDKFDSSDFYSPFYTYNLPEKYEDLFKQQKAKAILVIPHNFKDNLEIKKKPELQLIIDSSDQNSAIYVRSYVSRTIMMFLNDLDFTSKSKFGLSTRIWYNPETKSTFFIVPGLLAIILIMICALLTSITIAREKETGTIEQLLVSAVKPSEIIIGKVLPYIILGFLDGVLIVSLGLFLFSVPLIGNIILLAFLSLIFIMCALSLGLMISTIADSQQNAMMMAIAATLLPSMFLSGFIFPIRSMPFFLQIISKLVPANYYLMIVRGIMLKGNELNELLVPTIILVVITFILLFVSTRKFKSNLE